MLQMLSLINSAQLQFFEKDHRVETAPAVSQQQDFL
jgi:hypothetical protein